MSRALLCVYLMVKSAAFRANKMNSTRLDWLTYKHIRRLCDTWCVVCAGTAAANYALDMCIIDFHSMRRTQTSQMKFNFFPHTIFRWLWQWQWPSAAPKCINKTGAHPLNAARVRSAFNWTVAAVLVGSAVRARTIFWKKFYHFFHYYELVLW